MLDCQLSTANAVKSEQTPNLKTVFLYTKFVSVNIPRHHIQSRVVIWSNWSQFEISKAIRVDLVVALPVVEIPLFHLVQIDALLLR